MSSEMGMSAVSLLWLGLNPDCVESRSWWFMRWSMRRLLMIFSRTLAGLGSRQIGLQLASVAGSTEGFLSMGVSDVFLDVQEGGCVD